MKQSTHATAATDNNSNVGRMSYSVSRRITMEPSYDVFQNFGKYHLY